jgi:mannitol-1-phosphate 5-dehydrogenase
VQDSIIDLLNEKGEYDVIQVGNDSEDDTVVANFRAINSKTHEADLVKEISEAEVVTCSVGPNVLKFIAPVVAKGIEMRDMDKCDHPIAVIACENMIGATDSLREFIESETPQERLHTLLDRARFANSAIDRIVPAQDPDAGLNVTLEKFSEWVVEKLPFAPYPPPSIDGIKWVRDLKPFIERKLFTVNTGHAAAAYHGYHLKKTTVYDALMDAQIMDEVKRALNETCELIISKHDIEEGEQREYIEKIIKRISNPHLEDAVERVGRAPLRKLSRRERFIGPAAELAEMGKPFDALLDAAEMAFRFQNVPEDEESEKLAQIMSSKKAGEVVNEVCEIEEGHPLYPHLVKVVEKVQSEGQTA